MIETTPTGERRIPIQAGTAAAMRGMPLGEPKARRIRRIPLKRPAQADDIAKVAVFLASHLSDYMTGQTLNIDGGNFQS